MSKKSRVEDVMTTDVVCVQETASFRKMVDTLQSNKVSAVPVVDRAGHLRGVVSEADLLLKEADPTAGLDRPMLANSRRRRQRKKAAGATAAELMTVPAITITKTATVVEAVSQMSRHSIKRRLPVVDALTNQLVGIVSRSDLLRPYGRPDEQMQREISRRSSPVP